jgi:hypothetical protein
MVDSVLGLRGLHAVLTWATQQLCDAIQDRAMCHPEPNIACLPFVIGSRNSLRKFADSGCDPIRQ